VFIRPAVSRNYNYFSIQDMFRFTAVPQDTIDVQRKRSVLMAASMTLPRRFWMYQQLHECTQFAIQGEHNTGPYFGRHDPEVWEHEQYIKNPVVKEAELYERW
jgi:hypothetical protein